MALIDRLAFYHKEIGHRQPQEETTSHHDEEAGILILEKKYPRSMHHGDYPLDSLFAMMASSQTLPFAHPLLAKATTVDQLLFFDTETTGLYGGTGTVVFLLGLAFFEDDNLIVRQLFLRDAYLEVELYLAFLAEVKGKTHFVSYNGKAFDWPQVVSRHTLLRASLPPLPTFTHIDLLHAARRLWKDDLPSCRLALVEPEKLGVFREKDVAGDMAPTLYYEYLRHKDFSVIEPIIHHNAVDLLSLVTLYTHIANLVFAFSSNVTPTREERLRIGLWYKALSLYEQAIWMWEGIGKNETFYAKAQLEIGCALHQLGHPQDKVLSYFGEAQRGKHTAKDSLLLFTTLAKIYEHERKDPDRALYYAHLAMKSALKPKENEATQKRIHRLTKKVRP